MKEEFRVTEIAGAILRFQPGDRLVLTLPKDFDESRLDNCFRAVEQWLQGTNVRFIITREDAPFTILRSGSGDGETGD